MAYRHPVQRLVAVLDEDPAVDGALGRLRGLGVDLSGVHVLGGTEGAVLLDRRGERHGWGARLLRLLRRTAPEDVSPDVHDRALRDGGHVRYVPVRGEDREDRVAEALRATGGHRLVHVGRFTTEERWIRPVPPRPGAGGPPPRGTGRR